MRHAESAEPGPGAVDASGTASIWPVDSTADMLVLSPGKAAQRVRISGDPPGGHTPISALGALTTAAAPGDGFYAMTVNHSGSRKYLVHVRGTTATVLAQGPVAGTCTAGKQYDALDIPCSMPLFVAPSGNRILLIDVNHQVGTDPYPALAIRADTA